MIRALLEHHLDRARRGLLTKNAIADCHVTGLHSIVLHDEPENRIRLFYAAADHCMHWSGEKEDRMPLAIHSHHCDVKLHGVCGRAYSRVYNIDDSSTSELELTKCRFQSAITGEGGGKLVSRNTTRFLRLCRVSRLGHGDTCHELEADELHTVTVAAGKEAAWLVIEGREDPDYLSVCYTNFPYWNADYLYKKAQPDEVVSWLSRVIELGKTEAGAPT
jgi:hypothetical protein